MKKMSRNYTIYAVDFDGTLCESKFPEIGSPNIKLINHLIELRHQGDKVILWTCRVGERLEKAVEWCKSYGLEFDAINENLSSQIEKWGNETRKVFADVYIDDKAADKIKYHIPYEVSFNINVYNVDKIVRVLEKQIPKKPTYEGDGYAPDGTFIYDTWICPCCDKRYEVDYDDYDYCPNCGQKIDWSNEE